VFCSFYTMLPNELMLGWREHKYLPPRTTMKDGREIMIVDNPYDDAKWEGRGLENGENGANGGHVAGEEEVEVEEED